MRILLGIISAGVLGFFVAQSFAEDVTPLSAANAATDDLALVQGLFPGIEITDVKPSPVKGLLEISVGADIYYISEDGKYFVQGDLTDMETRTNLTEKSRSKARAAYLSNMSEDTTIIFAAEDEKYRVLVFTDIDCGYCRKLHRQMESYNELGITIQYAFFPRSGPDTDSWEKAEKVWCAESRQDALTQAKQNQPINAEVCEGTPVAAHYQLVNQLGLRGTPSIFTPSGELIMGYVSPDELLERLEKEAAEEG
jgi:thiol:disulfide interchange protein DsbC